MNETNNFPTQRDSMILLLTAILWLVTIGYTVTQWQQLGSEIPIHFGLDGKPDGFGAPSAMYWIFGIGILSTLFVEWIVHRPQYANLPFRLDEKYLPEAYGKLSRMLRNLNLLLTLLFTILIASMIKTAQGDWATIPVPVLYILVAIIVCLPLVVTFQLRKYSTNGKTKNEP